LIQIHFIFLITRQNITIINIRKAKHIISGAFMIYLYSNSLNLLYCIQFSGKIYSCVSIFRSITH